MEKEKKFVSLVVYLHDCEGVVESFFGQIIPVFSNLFEKYEVVCVDDSCSDGTVEAVKAYFNKENLETTVNLVRMGYYQGVENSMNAGRDLAIGDFVYEFDSVYTDYETTIIRELYDKLLEGFDIVGAKSDAKQRLSSKLFYFFYNASSKYKGTKIGPESLRIVSRRAINRIKAMGQYVPYRKAVYASSGMKYATVEYKSTGGRKEKGRFSERSGLALDSFMYFTNILERISGIISTAFLLITIAIAIYVLRDLFMGSKTVEGWMSIMIFLSIGFFGVFLLLTIVLKFLSTLLNLVFKQQKYVVASVDRVTNARKE